MSVAACICETGGTDKYDIRHATWGQSELIELSELRTAGAGWIANDTLVLTVEVTVTREDRFQLDAGPFFYVFLCVCFRVRAKYVCMRVPQACRATWP
jgi:hypothetical protein